MFEKYYQKEAKVFDLYAYCPPGCQAGDYVVGKKVDEDMRSVERYKEYKDVGFNMVMSGTVGTYYGEEWETSMCKKMMDTVLAAGIQNTSSATKLSTNVLVREKDLSGKAKSLLPKPSSTRSWQTASKIIPNTPRFTACIWRMNRIITISKRLASCIGLLSAFVPRRLFIATCFLSIPFVGWMKDIPRAGTCLSVERNT